MSILVDAFNYAYPNARIRAMRSLLISEKNFRSLIEAKDLENFIAILESTLYGRDFHKLDVVDSLHIEDILLHRMVGINNMIVELAPKSTKNLFNWRSRRYELIVLREILNSKLDFGIGADKLKEHSFMLSDEVKIILPKMIAAADVEEIVGLLEEKTEYGKALEGVLEVYLDSGSILPISTVLDKHYYSRLWEYAKEIGGKDGEIGRKLIGVEIDAINIMALLRAKQQRYDVENFLIPAYLHIRSRVGECMGAADVPEIISRLSGTIYSSALNSSLSVYEKTKSLLPFELGLKKYVLQQNRMALTGYPFQIGTLLGFLKLKDTEIENLRVVSVSVENGLSPDEIKDIIVS